MSVVNTPEHSDNATLRNQFEPQSPPTAASSKRGQRSFPSHGRITLDPATCLLTGTSGFKTGVGTSADHSKMPGKSFDSPPLGSAAFDPPAFGSPAFDSLGLGSGRTSTVLLGGSPLRLMKLTGAAETVMHLLAGGASVDEAAATTKTSIRSVSRLADRLLDAQLAHPLWVSPSSVPAENAAAVLSPVDLSTVTLVIPVKDREVQLRRLLDSLHREMGEGLSVVVVDDASSDASGNVASEFGATVFRNDVSQGPGAARNQGLLDAKTTFVAFVDSDCTCTYGWLPLLLQHFTDPSVALVAPRIFGVVSSARPASDEPRGPVSTVPVGSGILVAYESVRSPLDLGSEQALIVPRTRVSYAPSAALVARTEVLRELGGFDPSLQVGEDVDLLWRLHTAGWRSRYEPRSTVAHEHRVSWGAFTQRRYQYGTSAALLDKRHPGQVSPLAVSGWSALGWLGLCTMSPIGVLGGLGTMAVTTALLPRKLGVVAKPQRLALNLAGRGHLGAGRQLASATWRAYLPIALLSALLPKPIALVGRRILLSSAIVPNVADWRSKRPKLDPIRYVGIRLLDDAAYCAGVWAGAFKLRSFRSLKPDLSSWPGSSKKTVKTGSTSIEECA